MSNKAEKRGSVPKLRFPEFRNAGEWEKKTLDDIAVFFKGKGISKSDVSLQGETPCIRYGELYTIYGEVVRTVISKTQLPSSELFLSQKNDVLIPSSGETKIDIAKASCVLLDDVALGCDLNVLRPNENGIFLSYMLNGVCKTEIAKKAQGDTVVHLYASQLKLLDILVPKEPEQQKIADCLSSLDELITLEAQKLDTLKTHKKGLMQQIFPAEGETLPKLRFPEFREAGEWEEKTLEQVADYENGKAHEQDIAEQGKYIVVNSKFISTEGEVKKFTNAANLLAQKGDILMVLSDVPNGRAIAKCFYVDKDNAYTVNQRICKLTAKNAVSVVLFYIFDRNDYFLAFDDGVKQTNLKKDDVLNCPVLLPKDEEEQQKIADCLNSIDELITAQTQKLDALKTHKKGLMQQLFPALDEVQG